MFTTEMSVRLKGSWSKYDATVIVSHGLSWLMVTQRGWVYVRNLFPGGGGYGQNLNWQLKSSFYVCFFEQVTPYCGPGQEDCVSNQTLKDESCLVPCSGLYADIADDSRNQQNLANLEQNVLEGV